MRPPGARRRLALPAPPLTRAGWALLAAGAALYAGGVALGYPELLAVASGALLLLALAAAAVLLRPRLVVERSFHPARVPVGTPVLCRLRVRNRSRWPSPPLVAVDRLLGSRSGIGPAPPRRAVTSRGNGADRGYVTGSLPGEPVELRVAAISPGGAREVNYPIPTDRRGRWAVGPLALERRDPLGLLRRARNHGLGGTLWVHPRVHAMTPLPVGVLLDYEGAVTMAAPKGAVTFSSLREYVPGDDPRQLHWKATARTGRLMVKEHVDTSQPRTTVLLDTRARCWSAAAFEHAVELTASVVAASERAGRPVALYLVGEDRAAAERAGATSRLDRLAMVEPRAGDDPARLLALAERSEPGGALVVVAGAIEDATVARLAAQRRRFAPLVLVRLTDGAALATSWRTGMAMVRAGSAGDAVGAWNKLVVGGRRR